MLYLNITLFTQLRNLFYYFFHFVIHYSYRAQLLDYRLLYKLFGFRYIVRVGEEGNKKSPHPNPILK